jgi:hypothetical protein
VDRILGAGIVLIFPSLTFLCTSPCVQAMKQAGVKPGMLTYNTLISCCHQAKRLEDAFRIKVIKVHWFSTMISAIILFVVPYFQSQNFSNCSQFKQ